MLFFLIVIVGLAWVFAESNDLGYGFLALAVILAVILNLFSYFKGDKVALAMSGAKPIQKQDNPYVYRIV